MAAWPDLATLKSVLGATTTARDSVLGLALDAAIEQVRLDVGETEAAPILLPSASLAQAALILAVMVAKAPEAPFGIAAVFDTGGLQVAAQHPTYRRLLVGSRLSFPIA